MCLLSNLAVIPVRIFSLEGRQYLVDVDRCIVIVRSYDYDRCKGVQPISFFLSGNMQEEREQILTDNSISCFN